MKVGGLLRDVPFEPFFVGHKLIGLVLGPGEKGHINWNVAVENIDEELNQLG